MKKIPRIKRWEDTSFRCRCRRRSPIHKQRDEMEDLRSELTELLSMMAELESNFNSKIEAVLRLI